MLFIYVKMGSGFPGIDDFTYRGHLYQDVVLCSITDYVYELYVKKSEAYSWVTIFRMGQANNDNGKEITYNDVQVSSLPNEGISPKLALSQ